MNSEERVEIVKLAARKHYSQREIAERHNVSVGIVKRLLHKLRHNIPAFTKHKAKELKNEQQKLAIL